MLKVFYNLKTRDNPSKYTAKILDCLNDLRYNHLDEIVKSILETSWISNADQETINEIRNKYADELEECIRRFESVDTLVALIDEKNTKFHTSAQAKFEFLMNNRKDISGLLKNVLKNIKEMDEETEFNEVLALFSSKQVDQDSLYDRAAAKERVDSYFMENPPTSQEDFDLAMANIFRQDIFSRDKVNEFVDRELGEETKKNSKDIEVDSWNKLIMLMMVEAYSSYEDMTYKVTFYDDYYETFGYKTKSFDIERKEVKQ